MSSTKGKIIIVAGPSGVGKGTVEAGIMERHPDIEFSVSVTTRPKRSYEEHGVHYFFITKEAFQQKIANDELVEWQEVYSQNGHLYGTLRSYIDKALEAGKHLLLDIDIKGGLNVKWAYPSDSVAIFLQPPSLEELERRLVKRGSDSADQMRIRLDRMPEEMELGKQFDFQVVNEHVEEAVDAIDKILDRTVYNA